MRLINQPAAGFETTTTEVVKTTLLATPRAVWRETQGWLILEMESPCKCFRIDEILELADQRLARFSLKPGFCQSIYLSMGYVRLLETNVHIVSSGYACEFCWTQMGLQAEAVNFVQTI